MFPPLFTLNLLSRQLLPRLPAGILSLFHAATPRILILSNCTMIWWRVQETKHVKWNILRTLLPICFGSRCVLVPQFCSAAISHKVFQIFGIVSLQDISSMLSLKSKFLPVSLIQHTNGDWKTYARPHIANGIYQYKNPLCPAHHQFGKLLKKNIS